MSQRANAVTLLIATFHCTGWSSYVIFIAHALRKILQLRFQEWLIRNTMGPLNISVWRNVRKYNCQGTTAVRISFPSLSAFSAFWWNGLDVEVKWASKMEAKQNLSGCKNLIHCNFKKKKITKFTTFEVVLLLWQLLYYYSHYCCSDYYYYHQFGRNTKCF